MKITTAVVTTAIPTAAPVVRDPTPPEGAEGVAIEESIHILSATELHAWRHWDAMVYV